MTLLHVLAIDPERRAVLTDPDGGLPVVAVDVYDRDPLPAAVVRHLAAWSGGAVVLLELHGGDRPASAAVLADVTFEPLVTPPGCRWSPVDGPAPVVDPVFASRCGDLLAEGAGRRAVPDRRPRWARRGWYERASSWIERELTAAGRPPSARPEQVKHWPLSAVLRTDTPAGPAWFKAVFDQFWPEPSVSALLDAEHPGTVAPVIAVEADEGWLLLEDVGQDPLLDHPELDGEVIRRLIAIQRSFADRTDVVAGLGCPARPFGELADPLDVALDEALRAGWLERDPHHVRELARWIRAAVGDVAELGFPDTLVHGDFHPMNAATGPDGPLIFDWSDAAIGHPLVDAMTWARWLRNDPTRSARAWHAFLEGWSDVCPIRDAEAVRPQLVALTAGYHVLTYVQILRGFEPAAWPELAAGIEHYVAILEATIGPAA